MRVFMTGGSGFVGGHMIERLVADGHEVWAMARSKGSAAKVEAYGARAIQTSLGEVPAQVLDGVDAVIHAAAHVEEWGPREVYERVNVEGTRQLLEAAREAGVSRFVLVGTEAAVFDGGDLQAIDETYPYPTHHKFLYSETKARAEALVLAANDPGFVTLSIRPRLVWGPRDTSVLPAVQRMADEGAFVWLDGGRARTSTTHVANLCEALSLAIMHQGGGGEAYFVTDDEDTTVRAFLTDLLATQGVTLTRRSAPGALVRPLAAGIERVWRALGIERTPPMTHFAVSMMSRDVTVQIGRAKRELGYAPVVSVAEGMEALRSV